MIQLHPSPTFDKSTTLPDNLQVVIVGFVTRETRTQSRTVLDRVLHFQMQSTKRPSLEFDFNLVFAKLEARHRHMNRNRGSQWKRQRVRGVDLRRSQRASLRKPEPNLVEQQVRRQSRFRVEK